MLRNSSAQQVSYTSQDGSYEWVIESRTAKTAKKKKRIKMRVAERNQKLSNNTDLKHLFVRVGSLDYLFVTE